MRLASLWLVLFLALGAGTASCNNDNGNQDGSINDGDPDADLEPCQAAAPVWNAIWTQATEATPLVGTTPDINIMDVWAVSPTDLYAVGFKGSILHYNGQIWTVMDSQTTEDLMGVWGYVIRDANDVVVRTDIFAAGSNGTILRYNGTAWATQRVINDPDPANPKPQPVSGNFHDIWGVPAAGPDISQQPTVIAVGGEGLIARYEATLNEFREMRTPVENPCLCDDAGNCQVCITWERWTPERLGGVYGSDPNFFAAVGNNGVVLQYDGTGWTRQTVAPLGGAGVFLTHLNGIWGRGQGEMFAVGIDGTVVRGSAGSWEQLDLGLPPVYLRSVWTFSQSRCGPIPDGGTEPTNTSWVIFAGWNGTLLFAHDSIVCALEQQVTSNRLEGMWGYPPRSEADRTLPDGGIVCDPVEVFIGGVNGTIVHLTDALGQ
jgi:hypothetical protein